MRGLIVIAVAATLALAGCDTSVNAELEREVNAAAADLDLPERPAFPSLNAETIAWLSGEVPELAAHRAAIEAADKAILARVVAEIGPPAPSGGVASGTGPGPLATLPASGSRDRSSMGVLDWIAPPAHAQMDGYTVTAAIAGMATARMLGGAADVAGGAGSRTETIDGGNGEKATINISRDADGVTTTSVESNVDALALGLVAGAKTTFISKGLCPDPSGRVEFTIKLSQAGKAGTGGGAASMDSQVEAHVVLTVDDNAAVAEQDIRTRYARKSVAKGGDVSFQGEVDWQRSGKGDFRPVAERAGPQSGAVTDKMHTSAMVQAVTLAIGAIVGAESHWSSGACIRIDAQSPNHGRVDPKAKSDIPVAVISKIDDGAVPARVTATLTGGDSVDPAVIDRAPGTIVHTAPDAQKARMSIRLDAVSRRGKATLTLNLLISEGAYNIEGGADDFHGTGLICDIAQPFTVEGGGVTVNFTPSSPQGGSYRYSGSMMGFRLVGNGTYTVSYSGEVATGIVATGPGQVGTAYGMVSGSGDEHYDLTPTHNYNCE